jgi:hypothetical protein
MSAAISQSDRWSPGVKIGLMLFALLYLALAGFWFAHQQAEHVDPFYITEPRLQDALRGSDVVVTASAVAPSEGWVSDGLEYRGWSIAVQDVVYQANVPTTAWHESPEDDSMPPVRAEDLTLALEPLGYPSEQRSSSVAELPSAGEYVVGLSWWDTSVFTNRPTPWTISFVGTVTGDSVQFQEMDNDRWQAQIDDVRSRVPATASASDIDLLEMWLAELDAWRSSDVEGAIMAADAHASTPENVALEAWQAADPASRALDPELTPPQVFETLSERQLFVVVDEDAERTDRFLIVRTKTGVAHVARLSGGTHPAPTFTLDGESWEFWISTDPVGSDAWKVAVLPGDVVRNNHAVTVEISAALVDRGTAGADGSQAEVRGLTREAFQSDVEAWQAVEATTTTTAIAP